MTYGYFDNTQSPVTLSNQNRMCACVYVYMADNELCAVWFDLVGTGRQSVWARCLCSQMYTVYNGYNYIHMSLLQLCNEYELT